MLELSVEARSRALASLKAAAPAALWLALVSGLSGCVVVPPVPGIAPSAAKAAAAPPAAAPAGTTPPGAIVPKAATAAGAAFAPAQAASAARPTAAATPPGSPPSFASIIKDARRVDGPLTMWQKEDKLWIELLPEQFNKPYLLSPKIKNGIGEAGVIGGLMIYDDINGFGGPQVVEFVQVHKTVRLQARNMAVLARADTPEARAVASAYSNSLLASTTVASAPHPERKSVLVEANGLFLNDLMAIGQRLQRGLRAGYSLERGNTVITAARGTAEASIIETQMHFVGGGAPQQQPGLLGALLGAPPPGGPSFLPDARSMLVGMHYSLAPLPAKPMPTRAADPRIGLFTTSVLDFSDDLQRTPRQRFVNRWRLEKADPAAAISDPVTPITFYIDRNVPLAYRDTVRSAILEWNKAFEKLGFKDAIRAVQQPENADWDTLDYGRASVRWMLDAEPAFGAIGPSHVDPRTGEILDADIAFEGISARLVRGVRTQVLAGNRTARVDIGPAPDFAPRFDLGLHTPGAPLHDAAHCLHAQLGMEQMTYALDVLQARGELEPDSPQAQQFVLDYIKDSIMHEVGHALGLRHNFRASRAYTEAQLSDAEFTRVNGTTASVMEYNAVNLPRPGETGGLPFQATLGPYDYWAIEYAYKPLAAAAGSAQEKAELQAIAGRSADPLLAYGTDEDNAFGLDPETLQLDLGKDPIAFAGKRLEIARDLFRRQETRSLPADEDYAVLRRSLEYALSDATRAVGVLVRQIGGLRTLRDFPGSGRDPLQPVDAAVQRQALALISQAVLSNSALTLSPALQRRVAPDFLDRADGLSPATDFSMAERMLNLQRAVLNYLMSDFVARRVLDNADKLGQPREAFALSEVYRQLDRDVWDDLAAQLRRAEGIPAARRELQRDHVNRLATAVLRPSAQTRVDARSLMREQAIALEKRLRSVQARAARSPAETRAHLADSLDTLRQALAAPMARQAL